MRIMGLDVGEKRIGVAISDPLGWTAQGHSVVQRSTLKNDLAKLKELCQQLECQLVVVGLPRNMNGTLGPKAMIISIYSSKIAHTLPRPCLSINLTGLYSKYAIRPPRIKGMVISRTLYKK